MSTRTKVVLTKLVVFSPNDLVHDRLCVLIPMLCPAAVTNLEGDFGTTKDIALIGTLAARYMVGAQLSLRPPGAWARAASLIADPRDSLMN